MNKKNIRSWFGALSIRGKLLAIIMGITCVTLILANGVNAALQYINMREDVADNLRIETAILAKNIASSLDFEDLERAQTTLSILEYDKNIIRACLYTSDNALFAAQDSNEYKCPPQYSLAMHDNDFGIIRHGEPSLSGTVPVGSVVLDYSLRNQHMDFLKQNILFIGFTVIALLCAYWIATTLQNFISGPITRLAAKVKTITDNNDYTLELQAENNDETGRLIESFNSMIRSVRSHEKQLIESIEKADEANRLKGDFLAMMSHEIRTPMNGIIGMTELLIDTKLSHKQKNYAQTVIRSADSLLAIINDILDFSKIEAGKLDLDPTPMDLMTVVEDTAELMAVKARDKSVELIVRYAPDTPHHLIGDAGRVRQILSNLLNNAIKFTHTGYILLSVEVDAGSKIKISVKDTGIGIPPEKQAMLFQKFVQADTSTTRQYGGTGLGLAISKQLTEMMGGQIGFDSQKGKGSTFWFTMDLPRNENYKGNKGQGIEDIQGIRILVVDDLPVNGQMMVERLMIMGMNPTYIRQADMVVAAMHEAVDKGEPYQMAVLDYLMPDINGEDLARAIKADPILADTVLIMLSSAGGRSHSKRFLAAGFSSYLAKPVRTAELEETLALVWREYNRGNKNRMIEIGYDKTTQADIDTSIEFNRPRILLAEDNRTNQSFVEEILEQANCDLDIVINGKEAVKAVATTPYDLVYMDCEMPEMDGFEATRLLCQMRDDNIIGHIPIIALTANADQSDKQKCLDAGMVDYMAKPMRKFDLLNMTRKWLPDFVRVDNNLSHYRFNGYRVLLVEDNRTNQILAEEVLADLGFHIDHAGNGEIAVQMATAHTYDIILMDCQMPVMDGFEATTRILENTDAARCPIVALTANAMTGDRDKCLNAGMVDYLAKPIRKNTLVSVLSNWLKPQYNRSDGEADSVIQYLDSPILDEDILNSYRAIMGDKFKNAAENFLHEARMMTGHILAAYDAHDIDTIHKQAHTLKSSAATIGAIELSELCAVIEADAFEFIQYQKGRDELFDGRFAATADTMFKRLAPQLDAYIQSHQ